MGGRGYNPKYRHKEGKGEERSEKHRTHTRAHPPPHTHTQKERHAPRTTREGLENIKVGGERKDAEYNSHNTQGRLKKCTSEEEERVESSQKRIRAPQPRRTQTRTYTKCTCDARERALSPVEPIPVILSFSPTYKHTHTDKEDLGRKKWRAEMTLKR